MTKFLILIYGIVCYLLALATVLYAAGFEENLLVPKGIDGGTSEPLLVAIAINVVVLTIFVLQHTLMARPAFKAQWTRVISEAAERSTFVLAATAVFALFSLAVAAHRRCRLERRRPPFGADLDGTQFLRLGDISVVDLSHRSFRSLWRQAGLA